LLLPPAWLSVTLEMVVPPNRTKSTIVSPAAPGALKETLPDRFPVALEPLPLRTSRGTPPFTVSVVLLTRAPKVAWMVVEPTPTAVARPAVLIVATVAVEELHVAVLVTFCVLPSLNVPVAVNCCVLPFAIEGLTGATAIEDSVAAVTVNDVLPEIAPEVA
jgi:hypothetical protein